MPRGKLSFNSQACKGCGLCIQACPKDVLAFDARFRNKSGLHPAWAKQEENCIGCGNCAIMCPDAAITVERVG